MKYCGLGNTGLELRMLSYGSWVRFHLQLGGDNAVVSMQVGWEAGVNFFDNAEVAHSTVWTWPSGIRAYSKLKVYSAPMRGAANFGKLMAISFLATQPWKALPPGLVVAPVTSPLPEMTI